MPAGAQVLQFRSNIPAISAFVFSGIDPTFASRARARKGGFIVGGDNYGQGSSREHAALAPMYLGVRAVLAKLFARIHLANLINFGIVPLTFVNPADYGAVAQGHVLEIRGLKAALKKGAENIEVRNASNRKTVVVRLDFSARQREILVAGGLLNLTRLRQGGK
jgi:aconitate hydratase